MPKPARAKPARTARHPSRRGAPLGTFAARPIALAKGLSTTAIAHASQLLERARRVGSRKDDDTPSRRRSLRRWWRRARAGAGWLGRYAPVAGYALAAILVLPHVYDAARQWPEVVGKAAGAPPLVRAPAGPVRVAPAGAEAASTAGAAQAAETGLALAEDAPELPTRDARPTESAADAREPVYRVQLASLRNEADARRVRVFDEPGLAAVLRDLETVIERANVGGGMFYRVQAGAFDDRLDAEIVCDKLQRRNSACVVIRR